MCYINALGVGLMYLVILKAIFKMTKHQRPYDINLIMSILGNYGINISVATLYRALNELINNGFIKRVGKGRYILSTKGLMLIALSCIYQDDSKLDDDVCIGALTQLRRTWGLEGFGDDELAAYLKLLKISLEKRGVDSNNILNILSNYDYPESVLLLMPPQLNANNKFSIKDLLIDHLGDPNLINKAEGIIAKALLNYFPNASLFDGCRAVIINTKYGPKPLAIQCKLKGYILNSNCPFLSINKTTNNIK
ncbi:hypothetical protein [Vulcanisaeta thermophila]|uniref:hypothetical protein n=1 Tax=Vulcanisaeta thermophila TaxID=867917 RepID=UPI00118151F9|nr:hypothetical protein [Vulcanisaeta thermophila]